MFDTTNLVYYLQKKHPEEAPHNVALPSKVKDSTSTGPNSKQLTLEESADESRKWDINDVSS